MMDRINRNQKVLYNVIYSSMVFTIAYMFGLAIGVKLNIPLKILFTALTSQIVNLLLINPLLIFGILAIIFLVIVIGSVFFETYVALFFRKAYLLFINIFNHLKGTEDVASENRLIFWGILIVLVSVITWKIIFKRKKIYILLPIYMSCFLYYWYYNYDAAYWMMALFLFFFLMLMGLSRYYKEKEDTSSRFHVRHEYLYGEKVSTIIKYSFLAVVIALLLPKSSYSLEWTWLEDRVYSIFPGIEDLRSNDIGSKDGEKTSLFAFSKTGYNEEPSKLGGPISLDDTVVMTVRGNGPFYLRGNIKHIYTGDYWMSETKLWKDYRLRQDFSNIPEKEKERYYDETAIKITNNSTSTTTLFSPYIPYAVDFDGKFDLSVDRDMALFFPHGIGSGKSYSVKLLKPLAYNQLVERGIDRKKYSIKNASAYLQLPEEKISDSIRNLTKEIVKDAETEFEKATAIEDYLRNNYEYSFDVEEVPEGREFVEYFLFEGKKGYCTYYATSMAVMLRLEGIPCRYLEGYIAQESSGMGVYKVKNNNAHAWVEAFIEPVGWMTFEPTPAYPLMTRFAESLSDETGENIQDIEGREFIPRDRERWQSIIRPDMEEDEGIGASSENISSQIGPKEIIVRLPIMVMGIVLLVLSMRFLIGFFKVKYQNIRIKKMRNKEKVIYLYNEIVKLIDLWGFAMVSGETHYEFANRVARNFYLFNEEKGIQEITDIFVRNKYSNEPTPEEDVAEMQEYKKTLESRVRHYLGLITYFHRRYSGHGDRSNVH